MGQGGSKIFGISEPAEGLVEQTRGVINNRDSASSQLLIQTLTEL